jgi:hypothetical protein
MGQAEPSLEAHEVHPCRKISTVVRIIGTLFLKKLPQEQGAILPPPVVTAARIQNGGLRLFLPM